MNNINNKRVVIIGGGPGGLTLARLLQMYGVNVSLYERDAHKDARPKGATLDLHEDSGLLALQEAGLMEAFRAKYRPGADKITITDEKMNILFNEHDTDAGGKTTEYGRPEIDRGPLQELLLNSLHTGTVIWDSKFVSMHRHEDKWLITFENGQETIADIIIAADGANSKIRPYITPVKAFYSGYTVVEGAIYESAVNSPFIDGILRGGKIFAFGNSQSLILSSKGDGSLVFYFGFKTGEDWVKDSGINFSDRSQVISWFKKEFTVWDEKWYELLENSTGEFIPRPLYCMPLNQTWQALPNLTMLGDAAHLMPPFAGEGVNMAMLDALELSRCLLDPDMAGTHFAITVYETQMRKRASAIAGMSIEATEVLHSPGAMIYMRNVIDG